MPHPQISDPTESIAGSSRLFAALMAKEACHQCPQRIDSAEWARHRIRIHTTIPASNFGEIPAEER